MSKKGYADCLLGLQWGDEGKARFMDLLSSRDYSYAVRFQGGANAGHTVYHNSQKFVFHLIPAAVFNEKCISVIGNGVAFDPEIFESELNDLEKKGIKCKDRIIVSDKASIVLPIHKKCDAHREKKNPIGTTKKGIGPTYEAKVVRYGLKVYHLLDNSYKERLEILFDYLEKEKESDEFLENLEFLNKYASFVRPFVNETEIILNKALLEGKNILFEGAQAAALDIDFGTYPFVTSSNTLMSSITSGSGVSTRWIREVYGVSKSYLTRVGNGPFPTELDNSDGEKIRDLGKEYGATTGRPRRCGWLDLPMIKYYSMINGVSKLIITKVDIFYGFGDFKICTGYKHKETGEVVEYFPLTRLEEFKPIFEDIKGFDNVESKEFNDFINIIEKYLDIPVNMVSMGPEREDYSIRGKE